MFKPPVPQDSQTDFPIVQYADDTLRIMQVDTPQLMCLKALLNTFAQSTGLKVNFHKSSLIPINVELDRVTHLAMLLDVWLAPCLSLILAYQWEPQDLW